MDETKFLGLPPKKNIYTHLAKKVADLVEHLSGASLLLCERGEPQVRLDDAEVREEILGLLVGNGWVNNDVVTRDPFANEHILADYLF